MLIIRADASAEIGTGHVMRCLALAQAWQAAGGAAMFAQDACPDGLAARLRDEGMAKEAVTAAPGSAADAAETVDLAQGLGAEWVVVDGYVFGAEYQEVLRQAGLRVLFVDDYGHAERYTADLVLNQNAYADDALYPERGSHTRLLLGLRYLLLRREFWPWEGHVRAAPERGHRILVTLGGGDPRNITSVVIEALGQIDDPQLEAVVLAGAASPHAATVRGQAAADGRIEVRHNVPDMPGLLAWADVGITAGGSTCYEAAFLGLPCLVAILTENQRPVARALVAAGAVEVLGDSHVLSIESVADALRTLLADGDRRVKMGATGQRLVPGGGAQRVVQAMRDVSAEPPSLRPAGPADSRLLWEWRNAPEVRATAFNSDPIPWSEHVQWFATKAEDSRCLLFIAEAGESPVGQVRLDVEEDGVEADISVSVEQAQRGRGLGSALIRAGVRAAAAEGVCAVHAYIKTENTSSIRAFERAGFALVGPAEVHGTEALHYVWHCEKT